MKNTTLIKKFRKSLKQGSYSIGGWMQICDANIAEIMSNSDYEWITFDLEHGIYSIEEVTNCVRAVENNNKLKFVRLPGKNIEICAQMLDSGCDGLIVPNINTKKEIEQIRDFSYFPHSGKRGVGFSRVNLFGKTFKKIMVSKIKPIIIAMIENKKAISNLNDILSLRGLDAILIGPYDLSASMNITGKFNHPKFKNMINYIKKTAKRFNVPVGIHVLDNNFSSVRNYINQGFKFIPYGTDGFLLNHAIEKSFKKRNG